MEQTKEKTAILSSSTLHILAMIFMLLDHCWATITPGNEWMTCVGRMAFPIFSFMIVEGYFHTSNIRKYLLRLFIGAIISEIPFNLINGGEIRYPYHQNVLWTFLIALLMICLLEKVKRLGKWYFFLPVIPVVLVVSYIVGYLTMVDYYGPGIFTVLVFYFFRGRKWWCYLGQFICLYWINVSMLGGLFYSVTILGKEFEIVQQGFALLALIFIWLYNGKKGITSKAFQIGCYAFYPIHCLILAFLS